MNILEKKDIFWYNYQIKQKDRERLHKHHSMVLWFTGISGSGKSTLADSLEKVLHNHCVSTYILDGDNLRCGLCCDLNFTYEDRYENIRRVGEVIKLMFDAGLVVLATFISPYRDARQLIRNKFPKGRFFEIFVDTPLIVCEKRDPKGFYKKARTGKIKNFTGINEVYEQPLQPEIHLNGQKKIDNLVDYLLNRIRISLFI